MKPETLVHLRVWGDLACFTRPEMKVERVSHPVITPSAVPDYVSPFRNGNTCELGELE